MIESLAAVPANMTLLEQVENFLREWFSFQAGFPFAMEIAGLLTGIVSVFLIARGRVIGWPIGIINCVIYVYVCGYHKFYSEALLYVFYFVTMFYGWWSWTRPGAQRDGGDLQVRTLTEPGRRHLFWGGLAGVLALGSIVIQLTDDASLPWHDALTTVLSVIAQVLMVRRYWECWLLWIAVDVISPMNFIEKGMVPTAFLYTVYLGLAIVGYTTWQRSRQEAAA